jgi:CheY-like chemotaxis protein
VFSNLLNNACKDSPPGSQSTIAVESARTERHDTTERSDDKLQSDDKLPSEGLGQGSTFVVRLPITIEQQRQNETADMGERPTMSSGSSQSSRRILIVDDNEDSAMTLSVLFEISGDETQTADDGLKAIAAAETFKPDVALLDIGLPGLSGYEVAQSIRAQPWGKTMVLVALTGWGQDEDRQKSKAAGFNAHMVKPVDHEALLALLDELLKK